MSRASDLALVCYPPSWRERYGDELRELTREGDVLDLLVGAARAWLHPAGERTVRARRMTAISTVHVSWCVAYVDGLFYLKAVNDPPVPGLTTGASQPLWGLAKATFFGGWVLLLLGGTGLLARIAIPAVRRRDWHLLRPMLPAAVLLVVVVGTIPFVGSYGYGAPSIGPVVAILTWLALGFALVVAGAIGPVVSLRRSSLPAEALRLPMLAAVGVTVMTAGLALATTAQAAVLMQADPVSRTPGQVQVLTGLTVYGATMMWGAVALMVIAATTSVVSVRRALRTA
jgi:hypothetical protein